MKKIALLAEQNCVSSSIVGSIDAFAIANLWWLHLSKSGQPLFQTEIVTIDHQPINALGGITLTPQKSIVEIEDSDLILLPAFLPPFDLKNQRIKTICQWLRERHAAGNEIASTCTGTFLLAETGLLDGRIATTNWQFAAMFRKKYPAVDLRIDRIITEDAGLYCTGAATAFMNLCLHLIEKHGSRALASRCAKALLVDPERTSQSPYIVHNFYRSHNDEQILKAQNWIDDNYTEKISIDVLARLCRISPRQFNRRFKNATGETPIAYTQWLRIEKAKVLLERTQDTVNEITWNVGYEDINSFRRLFIKHTGMSPKRYRNKFSVSFNA
jgi:transcriptional regulator GlxA family with amidase domain